MNDWLWLPQLYRCHWFFCHFLLVSYLKLRLYILAHIGFTTHAIFVLLLYIFKIIFTFSKMCETHVLHSEKPSEDLYCKTHTFCYYFIFRNWRIIFCDSIHFRDSWQSQVSYYPLLVAGVPQNAKTLLQNCFLLTRNCMLSLV